MAEGLLPLLLSIVVFAARAQTDTTAIDTSYWKQYDLGEVNVTASRKLVKQDIDKLTYDMAHDDVVGGLRRQQ